MPNPNELTGTIVTVSADEKTGTLAPGGGGPDVKFENPVQFKVVPGETVMYIQITNPATGDVKDIITGKN